MALKLTQNDIPGKVNFGNTNTGLLNTGTGTGTILSYAPYTAYSGMQQSAPYVAPYVAPKATYQSPGVQNNITTSSNVTQSSPQDVAGQAQSYADSLYNTSSGEENKYIDSLIQQAQGQRDIMLKKLDAEHKLALGNDDTARAKFLENVADQLEQRIGRIPYDYQRYTDRELQSYAMGNQAITDNRKQALDKLANDERLAMNSLKLSQTNANLQQEGDLNSRGLIEGQTRNNAVGVAGQNVGLQNQDFANQFDQVQSAYPINQQGVNNQFDQQQRSLDFNHTNTMQDLTTTARRDAQDAGNTYQFGTDQANNQFSIQQADLERRRKELLQQDRTNAQQQAQLKYYGS